MRNPREPVGGRRLSAHLSAFPPRAQSSPSASPPPPPRAWPAGGALGLSWGRPAAETYTCIYIYISICARCVRSVGGAKRVRMDSPAPSFGSVIALLFLLNDQDGST